MNKKKKKILIASLAGLLVAVLAGAGIWALQRNRKNSVVDVYPMEYLNCVDYVDFGTELTGTITSDYVQEVISDGSKDIKKIYVKKGQKVKKGDKLLKYNVDEQELELQLQKLQIDSATLHIANMEKELQKLKNTRPTGSTGGTVFPLMEASLGRPELGENASASILTSYNAGTLVAAEGDGNTDSGQGDSTPEGDGGEGADDSADPLVTAKEKAKKTIKNAMSDSGSLKYDVDKTLENNVLNDYCESEGNKIDVAESEEDVDSLVTEALNELKRISGLAKQRDAAIEAVGAKAVDKSDEAKADSIVSKAEKDISAAKSTTEIDTAKEAAIKDLDALANVPYYTHISDTGQNAPGFGSGNSEGNPIVYCLLKENNTDPTIAGSVVNALFKDPYAGKYIQLRVYDSEDADASKILTITPDSEIKGTISDSKNYTVPELEKIIKKTAPAADQLLKSVNTVNQKQSGTGSQKSKYQYNLKKNALIKGSVINSLIAKKKYAIFRDYKSEDAYVTNKNKPLNSITITPDTTFSEKISGTAKYTISDLNKLLVTVKSLKVVPKKSGLKTVKAGSKYKFLAKASGSNIKNLGVTWSVSNAKSKSTKISSNGVLTVGSDEKAAALKVTATMGKKKASYLVKVKKKSSGGSKKGSGKDSSDDDDDDDDTGDDDDDSGSSSSDDSYTADELKDAISEKEQEIAEAKQDLNEAKINYQEAKNEVDAAIIRATISGKVTVAYTAADAPTDSPAVVVRADDGVYVRTAVSELNLDTVKVGGIITCTSYETNEDYSAVVREVTDYPIENYTDTSGNPNSSYYAVMAYIENADGLKIGEEVKITYDSQSMGTISGDLIYLPVAYVRTEGRKSYVYKTDKDGRLRKSYVKTGRMISGQFVEITGGISMDDKLAFPYAKKSVELDGAKTKISDNPDDVVIW